MVRPKPLAMQKETTILNVWPNITLGRRGMPPLLCHLLEMSSKRGKSIISSLNYIEIAKLCKESGRGATIQGVRCCNYSRASAWVAEHRRYAPNKTKTSQFMAVISEFANAMNNANMS